MGYGAFYVICPRASSQSVTPQLVRRLRDEVPPKLIMLVTFCNLIVIKQTIMPAAFHRYLLCLPLDV